MKKFFNIVMIFFVLAITLLLNQNELQTQIINSNGYIQNIQKESVVLVSNNILNSKISSNEKKNNQNFINSTPVILSFQPVENLFNKNKAQPYGCFIHNLSTNEQKTHQIRAP